MTTFGAGGVALITVLALLAAGAAVSSRTGAPRKPPIPARLRRLRRAASRQRTRRPGPRPARAARGRARLTQAGKTATRTPTGGPGRAPSGRWSEEARIRIEAFSWDPRRLAPSTRHSRGARLRPSGVRALQLATAMRRPTVHESAAPPAVARLARAEPTEAAPARVSAAAPSGQFVRRAAGCVRQRTSADRECGGCRGALARSSAAVTADRCGRNTSAPSIGCRPPRLVRRSTRPCAIRSESARKPACRPAALNARRPR